MEITTRIRISRNRKSIKPKVVSWYVLNRNGVAFRYEAKLVINGKVYYPDFMILCDDGRILIWEHFGLMDKEEYFISACRKLEQYRRAGYVQHSNLICTYEEDLRSGAVLEEILLRYELYS